MLRRVRLVPFVLAAIWMPPAVADASYDIRLADVEAPGTAPYDFDQVKVNSGTAARTSERSYTGGHSLQLTSFGGGEVPYARGIIENNGSGFAAGDDLWIGVAVYLERGYCANKRTYSDILRLDSYVDDDGALAPRSVAQNLTLASFSNCDLYVEAQARTGDRQTLVGPLPPTSLPEGRWNWVELHVTANAISGRAFTQLKINGVTQGSSADANRFPGRRNWNRLRAGVVSMGPDAGAVTVYIDRMSIRDTELGPAPSAAAASRATRRRPSCRRSSTARRARRRPLSPALIATRRAWRDATGAHGTEGHLRPRLCLGATAPRRKASASRGPGARTGRPRSGGR